MGLFDNESKQHKNNLITLQNIVLNINEKKLQVSEEFLDKMTKIYISKYMKVINEIVVDLNKVTNVGMLYKRYDVIMSNLQELIKIEPYYKFNKPTPTEFKAQLESNLPEYCGSLISREWRKIAAASETKRFNPNQEKKIAAFFESFEIYENRLPPSAIKTLERLHKSAYPEKEKEEALTLNDTVEEFVPEEFETVEMPADATEAAPSQEETTLPQ